nr:MAG TPA: hypothetical protein [Caudoviricetes sp.]
MKKLETPPAGVFCYPAIRQGYSRRCIAPVPLSYRRSHLIYQFKYLSEGCHPVAFFLSPQFF